MTIMGFVGLATEGGLWYLGRRDTQTAADAAAVAGALALAYNADATTAALTAASANGFTNNDTTTVTINIIPANGTQSAQVQATVSQQMTPYISALFTSSPTTVGATATAQIKSTGAACVLSTTGDLSVTGTSISSGCAFASNSASSTAVNITGALQGATAASVGGCCGTGTVSLARPSSPYHPSTVNPYSAADALTFGTFSTGAGTCDNIPAPALVLGVSTITLLPYETTKHAYCQTLSVPTGTIVAVPNGTIIFYNASISVTGGKVSCQVTCSVGGSAGANFVLIGDTGSVGTVTITSGTFAILGQKTNTTFPALSGLLFYGRGISPARISISSPAGQQLSGGMYFPNATLQVTGNSGAKPSTCLSLVANTVVLYSVSYIASTGCGKSGTSLAQMQGVRLVQ